MQAAIVDTAQTYGWDTVFAVPIADVNAAIVKAGTSPKSFAATDAVDRYAVTGEFGPWQLTTQGSGDIVRLAIPLTQAVITKPDRSTETATGVALVDVRLNFLHQQEEQQRPPTGALRDLRVRTTAAGPDAPAASVVQVCYSGAKPSFLADAALQGMLGDWLNKNLSAFEHVFATVNIDRTAAQGAFQWLQPTDVAYAYQDLGTPNDGLLGVLCMTEKRPSAGLVQQISAAAIPSGARCGLLISKERLLAKLLLPTMPQLFAGARQQDFALSESGQSIVNATKDVSFQVTTKDGKTHSARIIDLVLTIEAGELQLSVKTVTTVSPGIRAYCQTQNFLGIRLVNKPDESQTLGYFDRRPAITNHWPEADPGIEITEDIFGVIALIAVAIALVVTDGAAIGAVALVMGLVAGVMMLTTTIIQMVGKDDAPAINSLVLDATVPIVWRDSKDFRLDNACLNDSLQLGGALRFA
jgi:hypothetical protein